MINGVKSSWFGVEGVLGKVAMMGTVEELETARLGVKMEEHWCGALMYADS